MESETSVVKKDAVFFRKTKTGKGVYVSGPALGEARLFGNAEDVTKVMAGEKEWAMLKPIAEKKVAVTA